MDSYAFRALIAAVMLVCAASLPAAPEPKQGAVSQPAQTSLAANEELQKKLHLRCIEASQRAERDAAAMIPGRTWTWRLDFERSRQQLAQLLSDFRSLRDTESDFEASLTAEQRFKVKALLAQLASLWNHLESDAQSLDLELQKGYPTRWHVARDTSDMQREIRQWRKLHQKVASALAWR